MKDERESLAWRQLGMGERETRGESGIEDEIHEVVG